MCVADLYSRKYSNTHPRQTHDVAVTQLFTRNIVRLRQPLRALAYTPNVAETDCSALTLLVGCQKEHPARKHLTDEVLAWLSCGAKCK